MPCSCLPRKNCSRGSWIPFFIVEKVVFTRIRESQEMNYSLFSPTFKWNGFSSFTSPTPVTLNKKITKGLYPSQEREITTKATWVRCQSHRLPGITWTVSETSLGNPRIWDIQPYPVKSVTWTVLQPKLEILSQVSFTSISSFQLKVPTQLPNRGYIS